MIIVDQIKLSLDESRNRLGQMVADRLGISEDGLSWRIIRESLDARRKDKPHFNYAIEVSLSWDEKRVKNLKDKQVRWVADEKIKPCVYGLKPLVNRPIVVGSGPAGLFCALQLAKRGYKPLVLEKGDPVSKRAQAIDEFFSTGKLDEFSNIQFGEGGAGTFSDGKLTSRSKQSGLVADVLETFVSFGAPSEVAYMQKPHIGTDYLRKCVVNMRNEIINLGGEVRFRSEVVRLKVNHGRIAGVYLSDGTFEPAEVVILAPGHSARALFKTLYEDGLAMENKPFAIGCRIEHRQDKINAVQHRQFAGHPRLGAADYQLTSPETDLVRGAYTFCMCPGGEVVLASSEQNRLVVNGMSYHARAAENANSALLVSVGKKDYGHHTLDGIYFQEKLEESAYQLGGGGYFAPVQKVGDFLRNQDSTCLGKIRPSVRPGYVLCNISTILPLPVAQAMRQGIVQMGRRLHGFDDGDAILTAIETRSSSPIRLLRHKETFESENVFGLYPCGEGAGYAGGIVSSAIDGIRVANLITANYARF